MDRRIEKSKKAITDALIKLMTEKDFEKITINEIADLANVNRGTVYFHFSDKYDLLNYCIETHLNELVLSCHLGEDIDNFSSKHSLLRTFEYLEQNAFFYSNMLNNKSIPTFRDRLMSVALKSIDDTIDMTGNNSTMNKEVLVHFVASASVGLMEWWITNSMPYSAEEMVNQMLLLFERVQIFESSQYK
ncbi:TetR/AcrR family transcriptional regulator [Clostridium chromiireducens]|uniref:HTH-type transcriptional regulator MtrR n=1 Tax=Clostridium chromiireducens TaxID=225345 RepID=A0A1V4IMW7_9CLOT|nr:TetR/AcrR family transcriptional regulator [Clostridium chromiireducens]OPJ61381.1 HTH-type transcriptional regulator MtrR [Clostridium chromiireducens]